MRKIFLCSSCLLVLGASAAASVQGSAATTDKSQLSPVAARATCDAKYYGHLVGRSLDEARSIEGSNYRVLTAAETRGQADPKRMTIVFDARSNLITEVGCG